MAYMVGRTASTGLTFATGRLSFCPGFYSGVHDEIASWRSSLLCLLVLCAGMAPLKAQSTTGTIQGVVRDNQDAVIPGATVTVRHVETNTTRILVTEGAGSYRFLNMPVGAYELTVELSGFSKCTCDQVSPSR